MVLTYCSFSRLFFKLKRLTRNSLAEWMVVALFSLVALGVYLRSDKPGFTTDAFFVSTQSAALLQNRSLTLDQVPNLDGFKTLNVAFVSHSGAVFSKTGPWGGIVFAPFFLIDGLLVHGTGDFFSQLEVRGKYAATFAIIFASILLFAAQRRISNNFGAALATQLVFLFATTNLPLVSQACWIHGPVILLFALYVFASVFSPDAIALRGIILGMIFAVRPLALFGLPIAWRYTDSSKKSNYALIYQVFWATLIAICVKWYEYHVGLTSTYSDELNFSLGGIANPYTMLLLLLELVSPNGGMLIFYPSLVFLLFLSMKYCSRRDLCSLVLPVLFYIWIGSWWWGGLSGAGPMRLLSDCNVHFALLAGALCQVISIKWRALFATLTFVTLIIGLQLQRFGWHDMSLPNRQELLRPKDNVIARTYNIRAQNDLAKPYLIFEIFK